MNNEWLSRKRAHIFTDMQSYFDILMVTPIALICKSYQQQLFYLPEKDIVELYW